MVAMGVCCFLFAHCAWQVMFVISRVCVAPDIRGGIFPTLYFWSDFSTSVLHFVFCVVLEDLDTGASYLTLASAEFSPDRNNYFPRDGLYATLCRLFFLDLHFPHIFDHYGQSGKYE